MPSYVMCLVLMREGAVSLYVWGRDEGDLGLRPRERRGGGDGKEGGQTCVCVHLRTEELDDESVFIVCALVLRAGPGVCRVWSWGVLCWAEVPILPRREMDSGLEERG